MITNGTEGMHSVSYTSKTNFHTDHDFLVSYDGTRGAPQTMWEPADSDRVEIRTVFCETCDMNIEQMPDYDEDQIEAECYVDFQNTDDGPDPDDARDLYFDRKD